MLLNQYELAESNLISERREIEVELSETFLPRVQPSSRESSLIPGLHISRIGELCFVTCELNHMKIGKSSNNEND